MSTDNSQSGYVSDILPFQAYKNPANKVVCALAGSGLTGPQFRVLVGEFTPSTLDTPERFFIHRVFELALTQDEWDNWDKTKTDSDYIIGIAAKRFGFTAA